MVFVVDHLKDRRHPPVKAYPCDDSAVSHVDAEFSGLPYSNRLKKMVHEVRILKIMEKVAIPTSQVDPPRLVDPL